MALRLRVSLQGVRPDVWRELEVDAELSLGDLHRVLQLVFGWRELHRHRFVRSTGRPVLPQEASEEEYGVGAALSSGPLEYDYDADDGWSHHVELVREVPALAEAGAGGPGARVRLIGGAGRGPFEDAGGPRGYLDKQRILRDPDDPDHQAVEEWVRATVGPWAPTAPDFFDPEGLQAELDRMFGTGEDPALRQLSEGLRSVLDELPVPLRAELRMHLAREGALGFGPPVVPDDVVQHVTAPLRWLLGALGDDGVVLTKAGWLPPSMVLDGMTSLGWQEPAMGKGTREDQTLPMLRLREQAQRLGLVRKYHGRLIPTVQARRIRDSPEGLYRHLTGMAFNHLRADERIATATLAVALISGPGTETGLFDAWHDILFALRACGLGPEHPETLTKYDVLDLASDLWQVLQIPDGYGFGLGDDRPEWKTVALSVLSA